MIVLALIVVAAFSISWWQLRIEIPLVLATCALGGAILAIAVGAASAAETLVQAAFYGLLVALLAGPADGVTGPIRRRRGRDGETVT